MLTKRAIVIGVGILIAVLIAGLIFWFQKRSENSSIQFQNEKKFTVVQSPAEVEVSDQLQTQPSKKETEEVEKQEKTELEEKPNVPEEVVKNFTFKNKLVGFGHESASGRSIDTVILHSSYAIEGDPYNVESVISLWKSYGVAPHYMIARDGTVYQLVSDKNIAYHAGDSKMPDGRTGVNNFSIGVEILNTKTDKYTSAQYQAVKDLISYLKKKYGTLKVVGHDTIAPGRKTDPWNFDWSKL